MDDPYRYCSQEREDTVILKKEYLELAREAACKSMVLLKMRTNYYRCRRN